MKSKDKKNKQNFKLRKIITLAVIFILGLATFTCGILLESTGTHIISNIFQVLGLALMVGGLVTAANVFLLQESFQENMSDVIKNVILEEIPENLKNLRDSGVCESVEGLVSTGIYDKIKKAHNCEISILKMWIPNIVEFESMLYEAVAFRGCTVKVLLLSPDAQSTIKTRAETISHDPVFIQGSIDRNIVNFRKLWNRLDDKQKKRFQFKTHNSFVSVSLVGISGEIVVGQYLDGMLSTQGVHYRIVGSCTMNYKMYRNHFESVWQKAKVYDLERLKVCEELDID